VSGGKVQRLRILCYPDSLQDKGTDPDSSTKNQDSGKDNQVGGEGEGRKGFFKNNGDLLSRNHRPASGRRKKTLAGSKGKVRGGHDITLPEGWRTSHK